MQNNALEVGGGIVSCAESTVTIVNSIVADNTADGAAQARVGGTIYVDYSCIPGGPTALVLSGGTRVWGDGNIEVEPGFIDIDDFRLLPGSPCIDAGTNTVKP